MFNKLTDLRKRLQVAEYNAHSVRQLIAQRTRLFKVLQLAGEFNSSQVQLKKVLDCVETTPSQFLADIYCLLMNGGKEGGFFIEFGACDGLTISNTLILEQAFNWRGILSEPSAKWHSALRQQRNGIFEPRCVWSESGKQLEFAEIAGDTYGTLAGVAETTFESRKNSVSSTSLVESISLADMLREHQAPKQIDFISIDTEGSEYEILKVFPFDEYRFGFLCVEHQSDENEKRIKSLLESAGYNQVLRDVSGHDGFYVPRRLS